MTYTSGPPELERRVQADLEEIVTELRRRYSPVAVVLGGSYGRGEGRGRQVDGCWRALNDYDIWVITHTKAEPDRTVGQELAQRVDVDHVDIALVTESDLATFPPSQISYDLHHGGAVLWGPKDVLSRIPAPRAAVIPPNSALTLLFNRAAGLIGHFDSADFNAFHAAPLDRTRRIQTRHAWTACGDAALLLVGKYDHRGAEKAKRAPTVLAGIIGLHSEFVERVAEAYGTGQRDELTRADEYRSVARALSRTLRWALTTADPNLKAGNRPLESILQDYVRGSEGFVDRTRRWAANWFGGGGTLRNRAEIQARCVRILLDREGLIGELRASGRAPMSDTEWDAERTSAYEDWSHAFH